MKRGIYDVPEYATTQERIVAEKDVVGRSSSQPSIPPLARILAEFHTSMNMVGLDRFGGNMDRFLVFCLLLRTSLSHPERYGTISVHSAAMSLGRPFETVRRHIRTLVDDDMCERTPNGVMLSRSYWESADNWQRLRFGHDCFVRLIADGVAAGIFLPYMAVGSARPALPLTDGICGAFDLLQALADMNRNLCDDAIDLAIFSAILHANQQQAGGGRIHPGLSVPIHPRHAVRVAQVARALSMPDTTVRRRVAPFCAPGGLYVRTPHGLLVAPDAFRPCRKPDAVVSAKHGSIRLIIQRAAAAGLSPRHPARSYYDGRPASPQVA